MHVLKQLVLVNDEHTSKKDRKKPYSSKLGSVCINCATENSSMCYRVASMMSDPILCLHFKMKRHTHTERNTQR